MRHVDPRPGSLPSRGFCRLAFALLAVGAVAASGAARAQCPAVVTPLAFDVPATGASGVVVNVTADSLCAWNVAWSDPWLQNVNQSASAGNGTVTIDVLPNPGATRATNLLVASSTVVITQASPDRQPLLDLYAATNGPAWSVNTGWGGPVGTECSWQGITCSAGRVWQLYLPSNNLVGPIPLSIGEMSGLSYLYLFSNHLGGPIPPTLGLLTSLAVLNLGDNELLGPVPPELGSLVNLTELFLDKNALAGEIPTSLTALTNITTPGYLSIGYNGLYSADSGLTAFLDAKAPGWQGTQTVAPTGVAAAGTGGTTIQVSWTPIAYTADPGYYEVLASTAPETWAPVGVTADKSASSLVVSAPPLWPTDFVVRTVTLPHPANTKNTVASLESAIASASTLPCNYALSPLSAVVPGTGGAGTPIGVSALADCGWNAGTNDGWITVTGGSPGVGNGTVSYVVQANSGPARSGAIFVNGSTNPVGLSFTVDQADGCDANASLSPSGSNPPAAGAAGQTFDVVISGGCPWSAAPDVPWITVTAGASGTGNGAVTFDVSPNPGPARVGTITVAGKPFTVSQADGCDASTLLVPEYLGVPVGGGKGLSFEVRTFGACPWNAATTDPWISITAGSSGTGNGTVVFDVAPNPGAARTGLITAGSRVFPVEQAEDCAATTRLQPDAATVPPAGTAGQSFSVVTGQSCYWTVASDVPWIEVLSGSSSAGNALVTYRVAPNSGPARSGTITAAGKVFTVRQDDGCTAGSSISPSGVDLQAGRSEGLTFQVSTAPGCAWTATPSVPWIIVTAGSAGSGPGTVTYTVEANGPLARTGEILAAGRSFVVRQASDCVLPDVPRFTSYPAAPVVAGSSFTVAWAPVANLASAGFYDVHVSKNRDCSAPVTLSTRETSVSLATEAGVATAYCTQVVARAGAACPPELVSAPSERAVVEAQPLPAEFTVLQPMSPAARADRNAPPPATSTVVFRNVGDSAGSLELSAVGGFFSPSPSGPVAVPAGGDVTVKIVFAPSSTAATGLKQGDLVGSWSTGEGRKSVAAVVTLTVLEPSIPSTKGIRIEPVGSSRVWFRQLEGNPDPQDVAVRNSGGLPVRIAPAIGPGGAWLSVSGDFTTPLAPGASRSFQLSVDRRRRTSEDGAPPLSTGLRIENVDGNPEDAATFEVVDEEPPPPSSGTDRPAQKEEEFSLILGSSVSSTAAGSAARSVAHTGAEFLSDGWIRNRSGDDVPIDLYYTPEGADGLDDPRVRKNTVVLGAYASYRMSDFVQGLFGATGSGHVEVRTPHLPQLSIRSSVDSLTTREGAPAQYGAELPLFVSGEGAGVAAGTQTPQVGVLTGLRGPLSGSRTNVIFAETLGRPTGVRATLYDVSGRRLGEKAFTVNAYSKVQVNYDDPALFPVPWSEGSLEYVATAGDGAVAALATVIDNASESYVVRVAAVLDRPKPTPAGARRALAAATATGYVPTATRAASTTSLYTTDLTVTNESDADVTLQVTYLPEAGLGTPAGPRAFLVPGREPEGGPKAIVVRDVVKELTGLEGDTRGMLRVEGGLSSLVFASETSTPIDPEKPELGRSPSSLSPAPGITTRFVGVFSKDSQEAVGLKLSSTDAVKQEVSHPSIEEWADFRTDLVLAELAGEPVTVRVKLRKTGGAALGDPLVVGLAANERKQIDHVILAVTKPPAGVVEFRGVEVAVEAVGGRGRAVALATRVSNDPASKRSDTWVLGPPVTGSASRGGKK